MNIKKKSVSGENALRTHTNNITHESQSQNTNENWKPVHNFEFYEISDKGRVRNKRTGKLLKPYWGRYQYLVVDLYRCGNRKQKRIHRLVADAFCKGKSSDKVVHHIDGNNQNNNAENLEWVDRTEHYHMPKNEKFGICKEAI